jgi:hypothetical protein
VTVPKSVIERVTQLEQDLQTLLSSLRELEQLLREKRLIGQDDHFINGERKR